ncbi:MAG: hypothetical protein ACPL28_04045 [bacterium]
MLIWSLSVDVKSNQDLDEFNSVTGQPGTFVAGMNYDYMYQQIPDNYVDYIGSNGGTILFRSQENYGRVICYGGGTSDYYRSIYSTFNLGALRNDANTKLQLVQKYMEYLLQTVVSEELKENTVGNISVYPNPASDRVYCALTLFRNQHVCIKIFDTAGRHIRTLVDRLLNTGLYEFCWDKYDSSGKIVSSGTYVLMIKTTTNNMIKTITLVK